MLTVGRCRWSDRRGMSEDRHVYNLGIRVESGGVVIDLKPLEAGVGGDNGAELGLADDAARIVDEFLHGQAGAS